MDYTAIKKRGIHILAVLLSFLYALSVSAINMKVGDIEHISLGNVPRLQGCIWTISHPNDVVFTTTPSSYSTDVFIKAVNAFPTTAPCIVHCKYYYLEQDPATGKYTYSRTGYKDWKVYVTEDGSGGDEGGGNSSLRLNLIEASVDVDDWITIDALTSSSGELSWSLSNIVCADFIKKSNTQINVRGVCGGVTIVSCKDSRGNTATCKITVIPRSYDSYSVGDYIYAEAEGLYGKKYRVQYLITNTEDPQCTLVKMGDLFCRDTSFKGCFTVPFDVQGFKVTNIEYGAFRNCKNLESIIIHGSVRDIGNYVFGECSNLIKVEIEEGVESIGSNCFANCHKLHDVTLPSTITKIGNGAFFYNKEVHVKCFINPPIDIGDILIVSTNEQILYVPYGTKALYENASGWNEFQNIIEMDAPSGINDAIVNNKKKKGIYTVDGLLLEDVIKEELSKGIYIMDGKKVYVK